MNKNNLYLAYKTKYPYINDNTELLSDKEFIKKIIKYNRTNLALIYDKSILEDEIFVIELFTIAFNLNDISYMYGLKIYYELLPDFLKQNDNFLLKLIKINYNFFITLPENRITKKLAIKTITLYPNLIFKLPIKYKNDKNYLLLAIKNNITFNAFHIVKKFIDDETYESNKIIYDHVKNDVNIRFKLYNLFLKNGEIKNNIHMNIFNKIRRLDIFEFIKKNNNMDYDFYYLIFQLNPKSIVKMNNITMLLYLPKKFGKKNIFNYLSQIKLIKNEPENYWRFRFFKFVFEIFDNKINVILSLMKLNKLILSFVIKNNFSNNRYVIKKLLNQDEILKNNNLSYKLKYKYHTNKYFCTTKNINHLFYFANKYRENMIFKYYNEFINDFTIINKKLINKLLYYGNNHLRKSLDYYYYLNLSFFPRKIRKNITLNLKIINFFIKNNISNIDYLSSKFFTKENIIHLIKNECKIYLFLSDDLKNDEEIIYHSLKIDFKQIKYINNIDLVNKIVYNNFDLEKSFNKINNN